MYKVICLNAKGKPNEIPSNRWLEQGKEYTITKVMAMKMQGGIAGVKIAEINNDDLFPWTYFRLDRFGITQEQIDKLIEEKELEVEYV